MIARIWHGWTTPGNADAYQRLLQQEILPGIRERNPGGLRSIDVLRRPDGDAVEFVTVMRFESLDDIRQFVGDDVEKAYVPAPARELLSHFESRAQHYEIRHSIDGIPASSED